MLAKQQNDCYGFVVLNYNNFEDTIECVESILRITHRDDYFIVVVDNASSNNSFEVLKSKFDGFSNIQLILSAKNGGYSAGNNIGIRMLLEMGITQVIIATNDTEILSLNILEEFDKLDLTGVGVVGTDVVTPDGSHQNPPLYRPNFLYFLNLYLYQPMAWLRNNLYRHFPSLSRFRQTLVANKIEDLGRGNILIDTCSVYMLHGCFLYLTQDYLCKVGLLDETLFMYGEEDLITWNCELHSLKRLYMPSLKVLHKDGRSTKQAHKKDREEFVHRMTVNAKQYLTKKINKWSLIKIILRETKLSLIKTLSLHFREVK